MNSVGRRIWILVFLFFAFAPTALGQDRNSITGFVFGPDRTPVQRLYVELQTELYSTVARAQTNGSGMYSFRGLPQGLYTIKILTGGTDYQEESRAVSLVPISARGAVSEQVDFYLRIKSKYGDVRGSGGVVFAQDVPKNAQDLYQSGVDDLEKKKETEGFGKLKQALEIFPDYYLALDRLATEYLAKGYFEASHVLFTRAIMVNPRSITGRLGLGLAELRLGRTEKSIESFDSVIKLEKDNINAHYWKGVAFQSARKLDEALSSLQRAEKLSDGKFADVYFQLARVYKDKNKFRESAESLETFLKIRPDAENAAEIRQIIKTLREKPVS